MGAGLRPVGRPRVVAAPLRTEAAGDHTRLGLTEVLALAVGTTGRTGADAPTGARPTAAAKPVPRKAAGVVPVPEAMAVPLLDRPVPEELLAVLPLRGQVAEGAEVVAEAAEVNVEVAAGPVVGRHMAW